MNILYISYDGISDFPAQSQVLPYLRRLSREGMNFTLLSFEKKDKIEDRRLLERYREDLKKDNIKWVHKAYHSRPAIPATLFDILQGVIKGALIVKKEKIDVIHARGYIPMLMAFVISKIFHKKTVFDMRGFWPEEKVDALAWDKNGMTYRVMKSLELAFLRSAARVVVLTESARQELIGRRYADKEIAVIPCAVDIDIFKPGGGDRPSGGGPVLLYAGNLGSFYNLEGILDFFKVFRRDGRAYLRILSNYPKELVDKAARDKDIGGDAYTVEKRSYSEMPAIYASSDVSLIFYNRKMSAKGCSPVKLAESLSSGIPVVINSGVGDCDEVVESNNVGAVISGFTEKEYERASEKIHRLLSDRAETSRRCMAAAKRLFSLESAVGKYKEIYKSLERVNV